MCSFQNELKNIEDACDELMLADSDENIPYFLGEVFIYHSMEQTQVLDKISCSVNICVALSCNTNV